MHSVGARIEQIEADAWAQLQLALPTAVSDELMARVCRQGAAVCLATPGADIAAVNRVLGLGLDEALTARRLASIQEWFAASGVRRWIIEWSPEAQPADAARLFTESGGAAKTPSVKLYRELSALPGSEEPRRRFEIREIDASEAARFEAIVTTPLGIPDRLASVTRSTVGHPGWHFYLAFDEGEPIAGGALFVSGDGAWLGLAATAPQARRRGAQTALLHWRLREACRLGCRWASAETHPATETRPNPSLDNMLSVGFRVLYHRPRFLFDEVTPAESGRGSMPSIHAYHSVT